MKEIRRPTKPTRQGQPKRPLDPNEDKEVNQVMDGLGQVVKKKDQAKGEPKGTNVERVARPKNKGSSMRVEMEEDREQRDKNMNANANAMAYDHELEMDPKVDGEWKFCLMGSGEAEDVRGRHEEIFGPGSGEHFGQNQGN